MDALSDVLNSVRLKAVIYRKIIVTTSSWGIEMAQDSYSQFWQLLKGTCYLKIHGEGAIKMNPGEIIFVPHGATHRILGNPKNDCVSAPQYTKALLNGKPLFQGNDEETVLIGGHFEIDPSFKHPFINSLPKLIHITKMHTELCFWLKNSATFMNDEISYEKAGSKVILARLADIIFILIIRAYLNQENVEQGFFMALKNDRISSSLKCMHEFPGNEWTIEQLAAKAGMSRSLYCKEFKRLVGETPLSYLTNWRIIKSKEFLLGNKENISEVAAKVGYQSEAAFNRLFKTKVGETPAVYRRNMIAANGK
jgi:AraC-like DNA-binding protein